MVHVLQVSPARHGAHFAGGYVCVCVCLSHDVGPRWAVHSGSVRPRDTVVVSVDPGNGTYGILDPALR